MYISTTSGFALESSLVILTASDWYGGLVHSVYALDNVEEHRTAKALGWTTGLPVLNPLAMDLDLSQEKAALVKKQALLAEVEKTYAAYQKALTAYNGVKPGKPAKLVAPAAAPAKRTRAPNLTEAKKDEIRKAYSSRKEGVTAKDIAKQFGVAENTIFKLAAGKLARKTAKKLKNVTKLL